MAQKTKMGRNPFEMATQSKKVRLNSTPNPQSLVAEVQAEILWAALKLSLRVIDPKPN